MIDVLYFAWVRERIGTPRETVETQAETVQALVDELRRLPEQLRELVQLHDQRSEALAHRFADTQDVIFLGRESTIRLPWRGR